MTLLPNATDVSFNMTVNSNSVGTADWVYDYGMGGLCIPVTESNLRVTVDGQSIIFTKGHQSATTSNYSFAGTLSSANDTISGNVTLDSKVFGTFDLAKRVGHPKQCVGPPTPAPPTPPPTPPTPPPPPPPAHTLWPYPNDPNLSTGATTVQLSHDFAILTAAGPACPTLDTAVQRYQNQAVGLHVASPQGDGDGGPVLRQLLVQVADLDESYPQLNTSRAHEAYVLTVPADGSPATVTADTIWGAMYGMESFSQMVRFNFTTEAYSIANAPWQLHDSPRFPHRGR
jgi:hypothetical protein